MCHVVCDSIRACGKVIDGDSIPKMGLESEFSLLFLIDSKELCDSLFCSVLYSSFLLCDAVLCSTVQAVQCTKVPEIFSTVKSGNDNEYF